MTLGPSFLPVRSGLGDQRLTANHRCLKSGERVGPNGDSSRPYQAHKTTGTWEFEVGSDLGLLGALTLER